MLEQEKVNKSRIWAYAIGIVVFVVVAVWKLTTR